MTDLQNKLVELSKTGAIFKCVPFTSSWSIIVTDKLTGEIIEALAFDFDQSYMN